MNIKIRVGGYYATREGDVVGPMEKSNNSTVLKGKNIRGQYIYKFLDTGRSYHLGGIDVGTDLVEELYYDPRS